MLNGLLKRIRYLGDVGRSYGFATIPKFIFLTLRAKMKAGDATFRKQIENRQRVLFDQIGIPVERAREVATGIIGGFDLAPNAIMLERIHFLGFAALCEAGLKPENILELGTSAGGASRFLAELFPDATVHTFELPSSDPSFEFAHPEGEEEYLKTCKDNLALPNIKSYRANTMSLMEYDLPMFDLIWLDAASEYPEVAWDHFYCIGRLKPGGWLFSDDIVLPDNFLLRHNKSLIHTSRIVKYMNARLANKFLLIPKRLEVDQTVIFDKYCAVMHKPL